MRLISPEDAKNRACPFMSSLNKMVGCYNEDCMAWEKTPEYVSIDNSRIIKGRCLLIG